MGWGVTPKSCAGSVCLNSYLCCLENEYGRFTIPEPVLPIASKRRLTHYPRVTKKKNEGSLISSNNETRVLLWAQTNKQRCSYELKRIYICGVHLGILPQTSPGGTCFPSLSLLVLVRLLPRGDLGLYLYLYLFYRACMLNSRRICAWNLYDVLACSIPGGYVH